MITKASALLGIAVIFACRLDAKALPAGEALAQALRGTQASAVVLDWQTGAVETVRRC